MSIDVISSIIQGCSDGQVRLVGSTDSMYKGTVEICYEGLWGLVSDEGWDDTDAFVVCRQLQTGNGTEGVIAGK